MKKILLQFSAVIILSSLALGAHAVLAQGLPGTNQSPLQQMQGILNPSGLESWAGRYDRRAPFDAGTDIIGTVVFNALDFFKLLLVPIAVLYVIVSGVKLVVAGKKVDEVSEREKENIKYIIYGLILIIIADDLVSKVFFKETGECLSSTSEAQACARQGSSLVKGLYSLILAILGTVALFVTVLAAFRLTTAYGNDETVKKEQKRIFAAVGGLIVAAVGEFVIKGLIFREGGTQMIDVARTQELVINFTNYIAGFIGTCAFVMLLYGGVTYVISFGNEEKTTKARKIMISAAVGIVIALGAFGILRSVSLLVNNASPGDPNVVSNTQ